MKKLKASKMRKIIAKTTSETFSSAPHYSVTISVDVSEAYRKANENDVKITDIIIFTASRLLSNEFPFLNAFWEEGEIFLYEEVNIGYVVAVDDGMLIPVIRGADTLNLQEIKAVRSDLVSKTLGHKLLPDEYKGGTFTISNLGILPIDHFTGVLYKNQSGLLTMGRAYTTESGRKHLKLTLVCDHRLVDGYYAASFLTRLKEKLEEGR